MADSLKDKVVIVTGASSGIGEATTVALVQAGAKVAAVARRKDRLDKLGKKLAKGPGEIMGIEADMSQEEHASKMVAQTTQRWGRVDILVANAGVMLLGPVREARTDDWRKMMGVNVLGLMYCVHAVLPVMTRQKSGHIVTLSSVAGRVIFPGSAVYCATKHAVGAFSEGVRKEVLEDHIRVTVIEPGAVATELTEHITHAGAKAMAQQTYAAIQTLKSEDIAASIIYALEQPPHVDVNEILIRPTQQER